MQVFYYMYEKSVPNRVLQNSTRNWQRWQYWFYHVKTNKKSSNKMLPQWVLNLEPQSFGCDVLLSRPLMLFMPLLSILCVWKCILPSWFRILLGSRWNGWRPTWFGWGFSAPQQETRRTNQYPNNHNNATYNTTNNLYNTTRNPNTTIYNVSILLWKMFTKTSLNVKNKKVQQLICNVWRKKGYSCFSVFWSVEFVKLIILNTGVYTSRKIGCNSGQKVYLLQK